MKHFDVRVRLVAGCIFAGLSVSYVPVMDAQLALGASMPRASTATPASSQESKDQRPALERRVSLHMTNVTLQHALQEIGRLSGIDLMYSRAIVPVNKKVSINVDTARVIDALALVLRGTDVVVKTSSNGTIRLVREQERTPERKSANDSTGNVSGRVTDSVSGRGIAGVTVEIQGLKKATLTSATGEYVLREIPVGEHSVKVKMFGYVPVTRTVNVIEGQQVAVNTVLVLTPSKLTEVVTTATGKQRKLEVGNSVTVLDVEEIVKTTPITSVTDLLEGRVPGLTVQRASGVPGDPARIRIGGLGSINRPNDPIVVVDGIRVQGPGMQTNLAGRTSGGAKANWAPSPLDQIDPNSIETIEVIKGPSASTLYGPDAANGAIIITTKKGRPGPTRLSVTMDRGYSRIPGSYPTGYFALGHLRYTDQPAFCFLQYRSSCAADSAVLYQLLNDPSRTILGTGNNTALTTSVSGGVNTLQYSLTASVLDEVGVLKLPQSEVTRYSALTGKTPPSWMRTPLGNKRWSVTTMLSSQINDEVNITVNGGLTNQSQRRSSLESQLGNLMSTYVAPGGDIFLGSAFLSGNESFSETSQLIKDFYQRSTSDNTNLTGNISVNWRPLSWLSGLTTVGLNTLNRQDGFLRPRGLQIETWDTLGMLNRGDGNQVNKTINAQGTILRELPYGLNFRTAIGANYYAAENQTLSVMTSNLPAGSETVGNSQISITESHSDEATFGWYIEPQISHKRLWFSPGIRFDGGNTYGTGVPLFKLPKLSFSWLASDEPLFPEVLKTYVNTLRIRTAYGQAGRQPGRADRLRLFSQKGDESLLSTLGNTDLRPERSVEFEGGFDADLFDSRLTLEFTGHHKMTNDALLSVPLPSSISVSGARPATWRNIGRVKNTWVEASLGVIPIQSEDVTWDVNLNMSRLKNVLTSLGKNVDPFYTMTGGGASSGYGTRVAPGYSLFGLWATPVLGYDDVNNDGFIDPNEILYGDTLVYMGQQSPKYEMGMHSTLSLFRGALYMNAGLQYTNGQTTQQRYGAVFLRGNVDPNATLAEQASALMGSTPAGYIQTVSALRLNSMSINYRLPGRIARQFKARTLNLALQGTNLGLWTNYSGKDPGVNSTLGSENLGTQDLGTLPLPRTWQLRVNLAY